MLLIVMMSPCRTEVTSVKNGFIIFFLLSGCRVYSSARGRSVSQAGAYQSGEACAQLYDGHTTNQEGKHARNVGDQSSRGSIKNMSEQEMKRNGL